MKELSKLELQEPDDKKPYEHDCFSRECFGKNLSTVVKLFSKSGGVIALNGQWGTGKTTFIKMWKKQMQNDGYKTIYYNAWESDNLSDPIIAMIGELKDNIADYEELNTSASKLIGKLAYSIGKGFIEHKIGVNIDEVKDACCQYQSVFAEQVDDYIKQKYAAEEFKNVLKTEVAKYDNNKPLIFIVDELDRCNPHYAVKVLERIKHLFDIPYVVFVLAICKSQLEYSIKGFYGSSEIDSSNYLRRFFDIELALPDPDSKSKVSLLLKHYLFEEAFEKHKYNDFYWMAKDLFENRAEDIRTLTKIFMMARIVCDEMTGDEKEFHYCSLLLLCLFKVCYPEFYQNLKHNISMAEYLCGIKDVFPSINRDSNICFAVVRFLKLLGNDEQVNEFHELLAQSDADVDIPYDRAMLADAIKRDTSNANIFSLADLMIKMEMNETFLNDVIP